MEHGAGQPEPRADDPLDPRASARRGLLATAAVVALIATAVIAYLVGRSSANATEAERRGFERGQEAAQRQYAPGRPGYRRIHARGFAAGLSAGRTAGLRAGQRQGDLAGAERGRRVGLEEGEELGRLEAERAGIAAGAGAALGGFDSWQAGALYLVEIEAGTGGISYRVAARRRLEADQRYALCARNPDDVCVEPVPRR